MGAIYQPQHPKNPDTNQPPPEPTTTENSQSPLWCNLIGTVHTAPSFKSVQQFFILLYIVTVYDSIQ